MKLMSYFFRFTNQIFHSTTNIQSCELFDNFGIFVQCLLFTFAFSTLVIKKFIEEKNSRSWIIWWMDASKQGISAFSAHLLNLAAAEGIGQENENPCKWYLINISIDTLIGTFVSFLILINLEYLCIPYKKFSFEMGDYGYKYPFRFIFKIKIYYEISIILKNLKNYNF